MIFRQRKTALKIHVYVMLPKFNFYRYPGDLAELILDV